MATITFSVASTGNAVLPCGSAPPRVIETVVVSPTVQRQGYVFGGRITLRGVAFNVYVVATLTGDELSGKCEVTKVLNKKFIANDLSNQPTSFPALPNRNEWSKIRFPGIHDFITMTISSDSVVALPDGARNSSVTAAMSFNLLNSTNGNKLDSVSRNIELGGSDVKGWSLPKNIAKFTLSILNEIQSDIYGQVIALNFDFDSINLQLSDGSCQLAGILKYYHQIDAVTEDSKSVGFSSDYTVCRYNKK